MSYTNYILKQLYIYRYQSHQFHLRTYEELITQNSYKEYVFDARCFQTHFTRYKLNFNFQSEFLIIVHIEKIKPKKGKYNVTLGGIMFFVLTVVCTFLSVLFGQVQTITNKHTEQNNLKHTNNHQ